MSTSPPGPTESDAGTAREKPVKPRRPAVKPPAAPRKAKAVRPAGAAAPVKPKGRPPARPQAGKAARPAQAGAPAAATEAPDALIGATVGRCTIEGLVGVGRTARVYRAHYEAIDDTVAVKVLRGEAARNVQLVERFQTEARAIARVDNENVPKIYDVGQTEGLHYMVVELLDGEEILDLIEREGQVDVMDALRILRQAANGLKAAHALGLVHRDVKPQNLVLLEDGTVKVVDFGLAARFDESSERVGTPHYMAPEVCATGNAEFASDVYALGIVLYHLLVGQPPHAGQDIQGILRSHMAGEPLRPERHRPDLPREVAELVRRLTKRDPLLRPTAAETIEILDEIGGKELKQKETLKRRRTRGRARSAVMRRARAGKRAPALVAIALALGVVAVLVAVLGGGGSSSPEPTASASGSAGGTEARAGGNVVNPTPVPVVPVESAEEKAAREARIARAEQEKEAREALERATQYARDTWVTKADTEAVRSRYLALWRKYRGTPAGDEAKRRADEIKQGTLHPHPDKEWTSAETLRATEAAWKQVLPTIEKHVAEHAYGTARGLVPPPVSDESGAFGRDLEFWREHLDLLIDFQRQLGDAVKALPPEARVLMTPDGEATVTRMSAEKFDVQLEGKARTYAWKDLSAAAIARLALDAFSGKDARFLLLQTAFAYAHDLKRDFWDVQLEFSATPGSGAWGRQQREYTTRMEARGR